MSSFTTLTDLLREGKKTALLALPLIIGQLGNMLMMIADTVMVGQVGVTELAALTFGNAIFTILFVFGAGLMTSVSILTAGASGRGDHADARSVCRNGLYLAVVAGTLLLLGGIGILPFLHLFKQPPAVTALTPPYLILILISLVPSFASMTLKNHGDALDQPWPSFWIFLAGVLLNIILNQWFIFELDLGLVGAGWATLIARSLIPIAIIIWFKRSRALREDVPQSWLARPDRSQLKKLLSLGIPASFQILAEWGAFAGAGFLVGLFGEISLAAHQIALTTSATLFMIPFGIGTALTMRMGNAAGAGESHRFRALFLSGWCLTLVSVIITGVICTLGRNLIASRFNDDPDVIRVAGALIFIVALSQFVDAFQAVSSGILRGLEDVKTPAWTAFFAYWIVGIPTGWYLAHYRGMASVGIWWGLALGLTVAAIFLSLRVIKIAQPARIR